MYNILCIASILLLGSFLNASSPLASHLAKQPISVITEVPQNTFVNDTVNVITGSFYLQMPHMSVPGHVPLDLIQYYHSQSTFTSWFGTGMSLNYSFWMQGQGKDDRWSKLFAELPGGSIISCLGKNDQEHHIDVANKVLFDGASSFTYDKNGNLIHQQSAHGSTSYSYDALDRLTQVTDGETTTKYLYDCFNRRLARIHSDGTEYFLYQDMREIGSLKNGQIEEFRVLGLGKGAELGASIALELKGQVFAPIHDFRGNIVSLVDTKGAIQESYRYTAFGECEAHCRSSPLSPWRFASKRYDPETGFVYFARRYYAPELGRWITPDPLGIADGPNRYAYVHHNPLTGFDLYGLYGFEDEYDPIEAMVIYGMLEASVRNTVDFAGFVGSFVHSGAESYARSCNEAIDSYRDALANQMASLPGTEVSANELRDAATAGVHLRNAVDLTRAAKTITTQAIRKGQSLLRAAEKGVTHNADPLSKLNPKRPGSRGGPEHQSKIDQRVKELKQEGYIHQGGGNRKEEVIETPKGYKNCRRPDITMKAPDGSKYRENVGKSTKSGEPIARERRALDDIEKETGKRPDYTPYDR